MPPASSPPRARARLVLALAASAALGACAQTPESIAPAPLDEARYGGLLCADMALERARVNRELASLSTEQGAKRVNDAVGWTRFLPAAHSASTRDIRSSIALSKGEGEALDRAMARRCPGPRA